MPVPHLQEGICVIGAGNGGLAMAGHLALKGLRVHVYLRNAQAAEALRAVGGVHLSGSVAGFGPLARVTSDLGQALADTRLVMVTTPAHAHAAVARQMLPHLRDHVIVLNPGRTGGALEVRGILRRAGLDNTLVEAQTFIYASRRGERPGHAHVFEVKRVVPAAAFPGVRTPQALRLLRRAYPEFVPAPSVLETSLANIGAIFHPAPLILNAAKVEAGLDFDYYHEGITPRVAALMERVDEERIRVAAALGVRVPSPRGWLREAYGARGRNLYEAIRNNRGYRGIKAPKTLEHRYIREDVPTGLVPLAALGELVGVRTPYTASLIQMASGLLGTDFWAEGRNLERMGIAGLDAAGIRQYSLTGLSFRAPVRPVPAWGGRPVWEDAVVAFAPRYGDT